MALNHKPRVGDVLIYKEPDGDPVEITVKGFGGNPPCVMVVKFPDTWFCGNAVDIIWKFVDGKMNPFLFHKDDPPCQA